MKIFSSFFTQAPIPFGSWEGIHDGTVEGPACYQRGSREYSEDCLTLSVYSKDVNVQQRSVYFWIHGGALLSGHAGMDVYGPHYFMQHDIVLVVVQFRSVKQIRPTIVVISVERTIRTSL